MEDKPPSLEHSEPTLRLEVAMSDPLSAHGTTQSDDNDSKIADEATGENDCVVDKEETAMDIDKEKDTSDDRPSSSVVESKAVTDTEAPLPVGSLSEQSLSGGRPQYQLVFGMDDTSSEASQTDSPDVNNSVMSYLSQHHYLPSPLATQSHDLEVKSGDLNSLSHDIRSMSHDHEKEAEDTDGDATKRKVSTASTGDDVSSVLSSSTLRAGSVSGQSTKPSPGEKERDGGGTPDSEVRLEDIKLRSLSPDGSRETPPLLPKIHALNVLTSDSEAGESPPYSPVPYLSGESKQLLSGGSEVGAPYKH